ncbi:MAG: HAMP domain-containing histidine kinase [Simkaniaceae bacterium]|nr:HAMP domain-containing histidine kinase [Simkaniaceae bacterium]
MRGFFSLERNQFPPCVFWIVVLVCLFPIAISIFTLGEGSALFPDQFYELEHDPLHYFLETVVFVVSIFTMILAFYMYSLRKDPFILILASAVFFPGVIDAFHAFVTPENLRGIGDLNYEAIGMLCSRLLNSLIFLFGCIIVMLFFPRPTQKQEKWLLGGCMLILGAITVLILIYLGKIQIPFKAYNPNSIVARPYELIPFSLLVISFFFIFNLSKKYPSFFSQAFIIAMIPSFFMEFYYTFAGLFNETYSTFISVQSIKLLFCIIVLMGIMFDQYFTYKDTDFLLSNNKDLKQLNDQKNAFLMMASHDLRNPLSMIQVGSTFVVDNEKDNIGEESLTILKQIQSASKKMSQLIVGLLDLGVIESGRLKLEKKQVEITALLQEVVDSNNLIAAPKQILIEHVYHGPNSVVCDPIRIEEVVVNLLSNSMKFTPKGKKIYVESLVEGDFLIIRVRDEGKGMSQEAINHVLDQKQVYTTEGLTGEKGTGLGLFIAAKIVQEHGGEFSIDSREGEGSTFSIRLPLDKAA